MAELIGDLRSKRKIEHMSAVRTLGDNPKFSNWFEDVALLPNCMPELAFDEISLATHLCGLELSSPIVINAMTGGAHEAFEVNRQLATIAKRLGLAMALGSETAALKNKDVAYTYEIVREVNPDGVIIANVGMGSSPEIARAAVELVDAQLLQVHWNVAQELFMQEGDRDFRGALSSFEAVVGSAKVPVIAKEVGQGIASREALRFVDAGARAVDVGGRGGTNFIAVEAWRRNLQLVDEANSWGNGWGISTAATVCEAVDATRGRADVIASGGMRTADDIVKAMSLGAVAVGIAGPLLRLLGEQDGVSKVETYLLELHFAMRAMLLLTGSRTWDELRKSPVVVVGHLRDWLLARGKDGFLKELQNRN